MDATKDKFFKADKINSQQKAAQTDATAKGIISAEATRRENKTQKLRALRLEREAQSQTEPESPKPKRRVPAGGR
jgi:hypothetical protein